MDLTVFFIKFGHFMAAGLAVLLSTLGAALGQGYAFQGAEEALTRQTESTNAIKQLQFMGLLLIESGPALGLIFALSFITDVDPNRTLAQSLAEVGVGLGFGISALFSGIAAGSAVSAALHAVSRQPFVTKKLSSFMIIMESFAEISSIFSFVLGVWIRTKITPDLAMPEAIKLVAASLTLSLATIGIAIAQAMLAKTNISAIGLNQSMCGKIQTFTFMTSAFIETPLFFAFFIAIKMIYTPTDGISPTEALGFFGAMLSSGLGSAGPAIGAAYVSGKGVVEATLDPTLYDSLRKITAGAQAALESGAAYSLIISLMILSSIG